MRKQITIPDCFDDILKSFAYKSKTSESNIVSFALMRLSQDFNSLELNEEIEKMFLQNIKNFYIDFYCKKLPRGLKAKGGKNA